LKSEQNQVAVWDADFEGIFPLLRDEIPADEGGCTGNGAADRCGPGGGGVLRLAFVGLGDAQVVEDTQQITAIRARVGATHLALDLVGQQLLQPGDAPPGIPALALINLYTLRGGRSLPGLVLVEIHQQPVLAEQLFRRVGGEDIKATDPRRWREVEIIGPTAFRARGKDIGGKRTQTDMERIRLLPSSGRIRYPMTFLSGSCFLANQGDQPKAQGHPKGLPPQGS